MTGKAAETFIPESAAPTRPVPAPTDPVLMYDGLCGFCDGAVQFILRHDEGGRMKFAPLQGDFARAMLERHPELRDVDSIILVEPGDAPGAERISVRTTAALRVASYLGGIWNTTVIARIVPRPIRDWAYDTFARNRYRWFGRHDSCPIPSPEQRARFLP